MHEFTTSGAFLRGLRQTRPTQAGIPPTRAARNRLRREARRFVESLSVAPPVSLDELTALTDRAVAAIGAEAAYGKFLAILIHNELWCRTLAGIPFDRRLLLLPQCLRDADRCEGDIDEYGLLCRRCGRCVLKQLHEEAETLGYVVMVAEGSAVVMSLIASGKIEAVIGVSCLSVLEQVFPYMEAGAIPGIAIPLLHDGCRDTSLDLDWLIDAIHLTGEAPSGRLDLDALRDEVRSWFTPEGLAETLGPPESETERIAQRWLALSGKRWRPSLAVCAYRALAAEAPAALPARVRKVAAAVECFHKASLIHDDIEDGDDLRYGRKTLHAEHGVPVALNVGDFLLGEGYRLIAGCGASPRQQAEMLRAAADGHRSLAVGQGGELCWMRRPRPLTVDEVIDTFRRKTAPAFEVALRLGAICADAGDAAEPLRLYSDALGVAYQIRDDLNDLLGEAGGDLGAARPSLLLALAHRRAAGDERKRIERFWCRPADGPDRTGELRALLTQLDAHNEAWRMLEGYKDRAVQALRPLANVELKCLLRRVIGKIFYDVETMFCCEDDPARRPWTHGAR
jgi:geranylgeranyl pyrophosphate synthase